MVWARADHVAQQWIDRTARQQVGRTAEARADQAVRQWIDRTERLHGDQTAQ
jgi:hypothetical protein